MLADILIIAVVALVFVLCIRKLVAGMKHGGCEGCNGNCAGCHQCSGTNASTRKR